MTETIESNVMVIVIDGTTIRYAFRPDLGHVYEIRRVSALDLHRLRRTVGSDRFSSSATVQLLTHRYKSSHYREDGTIAQPARQSEARLLPMTPFA